MMGTRPTIQMVAELAGVSRGTVDRVLNGRAHVREEVRQRVLDAIRQSGYVSPREAHLRQLSPSSPSLRLGVLLPNWEGQFRTEVEAGIGQARAELEGGGVQVLVRRCETDLPQEALDLLEDLRREGAAGLAVCAVNDPSVSGALAEAAEAGVPCVTFNSDLPESRRLCFVGQDIHRSGRVAGGLMARLTGREGTVLAAVGNLKFDGHRSRLDGFCQRMAETGFPAERIAVAETFNDYETTLRIVGEAIAAHPGLRGVYMANLSVSGCAAAIEKAGRKGQIHVVCHDVNESVRRLLLDGSVDFTIPQDFVRQGRVPLLLLRDYVRTGRLTDQRRFREQIDILCAENLPEV